MSEPASTAPPATRGLPLSQWLLTAIGNRWLLPILLSAAPLGVLVVLIRRYYVDVPVWDQWEIVPLLEKAYSRSLTIGDLWAQHNEHRLFFPQLIMLGLARLSGWSIGYELTLNVALAVGTFVVLAVQLRHVQRVFNLQAYFLYLLPLMALEIFSLQQYENWLWGWQIQIFLNAFAAVLGLTLLARPHFRWIYFVIACACGVVALYSFANGLVYWPIGGLVLLAAHTNPNRQIKLARWLWLVVAGVTIGSFLIGYRSPGGQLPWLILLQQPVAYFRYVVAYLGAPIFSFDQNWAAWGGLLCLAMFGWLVWLARNLPLDRRCALLPFVALGVYSISSAALTGLGRAAFGTDQALSSRYITLSGFLVIADSLLIVVLAQLLPPPRRMFSVVAAPAAAAVLLALVALSSWQAVTRFADRHDYLLPARAALLSLSNDGLLARLYPDLAAVRLRGAFLQAHHLSVFRDVEH